MPIPYGRTKRALVDAFIRKHPGIHKTANIAEELGVSQPVVSAALHEQMMNFPSFVIKHAAGRRTLWEFCFPKREAK